MKLQSMQLLPADYALSGAYPYSPWPFTHTCIFLLSVACLSQTDTATSSVSNAKLSVTWEQLAPQTMSLILHDLGDASCNLGP